LRSLLQPLNLNQILLQNLILDQGHSQPQNPNLLRSQFLNPLLSLL
jgi:hypothetical protein